MRIRFHTNPDGLPHIHDHNVTEEEVVEALSRFLERVSGRDDSVIAIGRTRSGRILKIIYAPARDGDGIFVITAFDLPPKQAKALQRRLNRRRRT